MLDGECADVLLGRIGFAVDSVCDMSDELEKWLTDQMVENLRKQQRTENYIQGDGWPNQLLLALELYAKATNLEERVRLPKRSIIRVRERNEKRETFNSGFWHR